MYAVRMKILTDRLVITILYISNRLGYAEMNTMSIFWKWHYKRIV